MYEDEVPPSESNQSAAACEPEPTGRRLLIVEDDHDLWEILRRAASSIDSKVQIDFVDTAEDGIDRLAEEARYDLVMTDFLLGGSKTGHWLSKHRERLQPDARFAMMSSMPIGSLGQEECPFLPKPFTVSQCREFLREVLS